MGLLRRIVTFFRGWNRGTRIQFGPAPVGPPALAPPTLELFAALPGQGKTSFLWSLLFMLRNLGTVWPDYSWGALDPATGEAMESIFGHLCGGPPPRLLADNGEMRYDLALSRMERWGRHRLVVWDRPHSATSTAANGNGSSPINWEAPACWLVSLHELDPTRGQFLDVLFEALVRGRVLSGHPLYRPFKVVVVLTKADTIADLPQYLRAYLKEDPLWEVASRQSPWQTGEGSGPERKRLDAEGLQHYLGTLWEVHQRIEDWLKSTPAGAMLVQRAADYHVELRFAVVSATGAATASGPGGHLAWSPRRVLDPYFWALELGSRRV